MGFKFSVIDPLLKHRGFRKVFLSESICGFKRHCFCFENIIFRADLQFQSQNGSIKSETLQATLIDYDGFQSQTGAIRRKNTLKADLIINGFNPKLVRLEVF